MRLPGFVPVQCVSSALLILSQAIVPDSLNAVDPLLYKNFIDLGKYEVSYLEALPSAGFAAERKALLGRWLYFGALFQAAIDTGFDFHQTLFTTPAIPQGFKGSNNYFAGISPESIKETELRNAYYDSIVKNSWINAQFNRQVDLRKNYRALLENLKYDISLLYGKPPQNTAELDMLLNGYITDSIYRQSVLDQVNENMREK